MILRSKFNYYRKWLRYLWCRHRDVSHHHLSTPAGTFMYVECNKCLYTKFYRIGVGR